MKVSPMKYKKIIIRLLNNKIKFKLNTDNIAYELVYGKILLFKKKELCI